MDEEHMVLEVHTCEHH